MFLSFCCASNWSVKVLIDDLIAGGAPGSGCSIACLMPQLRNAVHFTLSAEFAAVADALSTDYSGLVRAFPHCRLPFPITWIEMAQAERPTFYDAQIQAPGFQIAPKRIGYLLTATREDLSAWKAHLFWSMDNEDKCSCPALAMEFDMAGSYSSYPLPTDEAMRESVHRSLVLEEVDSHPGWKRADDTVKKAMLAHTCPITPDYGIPALPDNVPPGYEQQFYEVIADLSRSDWAGEPAYLLAVVGLLNAKNAVETSTVEYHKLNRARVKRGKHPLLEHKVLKIARRQLQRVYGADGVRGNYAPMRRHFCRGHFKTRKTGIFFWHPHVRGYSKHGTITKDYEVTR
jgi:hypothetical protein